MADHKHSEHVDREPVDHEAVGHEPMTGELKPTASTVLDPVCGMFVDPQKARSTVEFQGQKYFFCSPGCAQRFQASPETYLSAAKPPSPVVALGAIAPAKSPAPPTVESPGAAYVCPMDPDVREPRPGACPKCGMALEAEGVEYTCPMHPEILRS